MKVKDILGEAGLLYDEKRGHIVVGGWDRPNASGMPSTYGSSSKAKAETNSGIDVLRELEGTPEWKEMTDIMRFASTDRELKNGTLHFATKNHTGPHVFIYASGQIRRTTHYVMGNPSRDKYYQVKSPAPSADMIERYKNALTVAAKYSKKMLKIWDYNFDKAKQNNQDYQLAAAAAGITDIRELNLPKHFSNHINLANNDIRSFDGLPEYIGGNLNLKGNPIKSLSGFSDVVKTIAGGKLTIPISVRSGLLSLLNVKGLKSVEIGTTTIHPDRSRSDGLQKLSKAVDIVNKHLGQPAAMLRVQEELIDAGLEDFATI